MWLILWLTLSLAAPPPPAQQTPSGVAAATAQSAGSKVWIGRYAEFEEFIRSAKIVRLEDIGVGVTRPRHAFFAPGGLAGGAIVKNLPPGRKSGYWESYKSEIAAYKLDRLLEMDMVPVTVEREVEGTRMSAQLWVENTRTLKKVQGEKSPEKSPDVEGWNRQVYRQRVFDDLVSNIDENAGNMLIDQAWNIILVDHSRCFTTISKMPFPLTRIDRPFFERLKALDGATVKKELNGLMTSDAIDEVLKRRDQIVKTFEKLAAEKGEAQVFVS